MFKICLFNHAEDVILTHDQIFFAINFDFKINKFFLDCGSLILATEAKDVGTWEGNPKPYQGPPIPNNGNTIEHREEAVVGMMAYMPTTSNPVSDPTTNFPSPGYSLLVETQRTPHAGIEPSHFLQTTHGGTQLDDPARKTQLMINNHSFSSPILRIELWEGDMITS